MHDAAQTPQVRRGVVLLLNETNLWRPVPPRADMQTHSSLHCLTPISVVLQVLSHVTRDLLLVLSLPASLKPQMQAVLKVRNVVDLLASQALNLSFVGTSLRKRPGEAEVAESHVAALVNEDVGRFDVAMHHIAHVHEGHRTQAVVEEFRNVQLRQFHLVLQQTV